MSDKATITDSTKNEAQPKAAETLAPQLQEGKSRAHDAAADTHRLVVNGVLPDVSVAHAPGKEPGESTSMEQKPAVAPAHKEAPLPQPESKPAGNHIWNDIVATGSDLFKGAVDEVTKHPEDLVKDAAIGVVTGVAAAGIVAGAALIAPVAGTIAGGAMIAMGVAGVGIELAEHGKQWLHDTTVVGNPALHPQNELAKAHADLQSVGSGIPGAAVMIGTGLFAGGLTAAAIRGASTAGAAGIEASSGNIGSSGFDQEAQAGIGRVVTAPEPAPPPSETAIAPSAEAGAITEAAPAAPIVMTGDAAPAAPTVPEAATGEVAITAPAASEASTGSAEATAAKAPRTLAQIMADIRAEDGTEMTPFRAADSTLSTRNAEAASSWNQIITREQDSDMGSTVNRFANNWATLMEKRMAAGEKLTTEMAEQTSNEADTEGISGSMYQFGKNTLYRVWKYGPELEKVLQGRL